tara:strand:- start:69 stop:680 length:612 start_codon:yes stop_codon:yes gene_type:complete
MAIIYTYPTKTTPVAADTILISDSADSNATKKITVSSLTALGTGVSSIVAGTNTTISPISGVGAVTINSTPGTGVQYKIPMWSTTSALGDSLLAQDAGATTITFGTAASGQTLDISGQNRISFKGDSTNSYIAANNTNPESLEIHADNQLYLRPDGYVVIDGSTTVPASVGDSGDKGSIVFNATHLYIAVEDDTWRRVALSTF